MRDDLVTCETEGDGMGGFAAQETAQALDIKPFGGCEIMHGKCEVKESGHTVGASSHCIKPARVYANRSWTCGRASQPINPATMRGVLCRMANLPSEDKTKTPAAPSIR